MLDAFPNLAHFTTARNPAKLLTNDECSPLFLVVIEATEEATYNSLLKAVTVTSNGRTVEALPLERRWKFCAGIE